MPPTRIFVNIVVRDPLRAARFYEEVFDLQRMFESEWFVHLGLPSNPGLELGLLKQGYDVLPTALTHASNEARTLLTIVVANTDESYERAVAQGGECLERPRDLFYGQRRAVVRSPDGTLIDISSPCTPSSEWMARVAQKEGGGYVESSD